MSASHHTGAVVSRAEQPLGLPWQADQHSSGALTVILLLCQYFLHCVLFWSELPVCSLGPHTYISWEIRSARVALSTKASSSPSFSESSSGEQQHKTLSSSRGRATRCSFGWSSSQPHSFLDVQWTHKSLASPVTAPALSVWHDRFALHMFLRHCKHDSNAKQKSPACYHQRGSADNQHSTVSVARELGMPELRKPNITVGQIWIWLWNVKLPHSVLRFLYIHHQNISAIQKFTSTQGKLPQNKWIRNQVKRTSHWVNQSSSTISIKYLKEKTG